MILVSSLPLRLPAAHTSLVSDARILHTTPPSPRRGRVTRSRSHAPVARSHSLTVPSSEEERSRERQNCRHVTALWCLLGPGEEGRRGGAETMLGYEIVFMLSDQIQGLFVLC